MQAPPEHFEPVGHCKLSEAGRSSVGRKKYNVAAFPTVQTISLEVGTRAIARGKATVGANASTSNACCTAWALQLVRSWPFKRVKKGLPCCHISHSSDYQS